MRDRTPKMLDFLGWLRRRRVTRKKAWKLPDVLELANVAARRREVKYLFEGGV
jgi:hypothetical protein